MVYYSHTVNFVESTVLLKGTTVENLVIDAEFESLIPPMMADERELLRVSIERDGLRDPLVAWNCHPPVLLDGHNRYRIMQAQGGSTMTTRLAGMVKYLAFADRDTAKAWIIDNQLGRRNLADIDKAALVEAKHAILAKRAKERMLAELKNQNVVPKNFSEREKGEVRNQLAAEIGVSGPTYDNLRKVNQQGAPELRQAVREGKIGASTAATLAELPEQEQAAVVASADKKIILAAAKEIKKKDREQKIEARIQRSAEVGEAAPLPQKKYRIVYADPPWNYNDKCDAGAVQSGGCEKYYPSMSIGELCALPVRDMVEQNAVLFLWVTSPLLFECLPVIQAWGFAYKASFVWDKVKHNMGHYNSVRHELLLICTRGSCLPDSKNLIDSVQSIERTEHSRKPDAFREIIDQLYTAGRRIELFRRGVAPSGWDAWGNEAVAREA